MNSVKPQWIGLFVTMGFAALVGLVVVFGGGMWRSDTHTFVLFFDQSVNGLHPGSSVKFRGVPVGSVERIALRVEGQKPESRAVPVLIKVDRRRLERDLGVGGEFLGEGSFEQTLRRGLCGRLNLESFITGQLFVELDFVDRHDLVFHLAESHESMREIPTVRSPFDELTADIVELIGDFEEVDIEALSRNLDRLLVSAANAIEETDFPRLAGEATRLLEQVNELLERQDIGGAIDSFGEASAAITALAGEAEKALRALGEEGLPLGEDLLELAKNWSAAAEEVTRFTRELSLMLGDDSDFRFEAGESLREIGRAARSIRNFITYLERNPRALLTGRESRDNWPEESE
ncbi:MAG: MCE family protein [Opitutales bacterium]|nr:MCE family protein [Opitutales bacterium]MCH8540555.1 MlaD family protein [Opitutales bacterium]